MTAMDPSDENGLVSALEESDYHMDDIGGGVYVVYERDTSKPDNKGRYVGNLHFSKTPDGTQRGADTAIRRHGVTISGPATGVQFGYGNTQNNVF